MSKPLSEIVPHLKGMAAYFREIKDTESANAFQLLAQLFEKNKQRTIHELRRHLEDGFARDRINALVAACQEHERQAGLDALNETALNETLGSIEALTVTEAKCVASELGITSRPRSRGEVVSAIRSIIFLAKRKGREFKV